MIDDSQPLFSNKTNLDISDFEIGSHISYAPAPEGQKDLTNKNIVGNLIYKHQYYNDLFSIPIYDKENENDKYKIACVYEKEGRFSDAPQDNFYITNVDDFLTKNTAYLGYEKLENAIQNSEKTTFQVSLNELDDFSQLDDYSDLIYNNTYVSLIQNMRDYGEVFEPHREPIINDLENFNNGEFEVKYNPEKQHIFVNDVPTHEIDENNEIRLLNDNLSKDLEKDFFNRDYKFSFNDFKTLEDDSYIYLDISDYKNSDDTFLNNLISDINPKELLIDSAKQRINSVDQEIDYRNLNVLKNDINTFKFTNNLNGIDEIDYLTTNYDNKLNTIANNLESNIDKSGLQNTYFAIDNPLHLMKSTTYSIYDYLEHDLRSNAGLSRENNSLNEVLTYLNDSKNDKFNVISEHDSKKSMMMSKYSLSILDNQKFKLENSNASTLNERTKEESFYEGMKSAILPQNNISLQKYKEREDDISIINDFIRYAKSEVKGIELKPNFIKDSVESEDNSIDFDSILIGSSEKHDSFIDNLKEEKDLNKNNELDI